MPADIFVRQNDAQHIPDIFLVSGFDSTRRPLTDSLVIWRLKSFSIPARMISAHITGGGAHYLLQPSYCMMFSALTTSRSGIFQ